jgi:hypothetical protein
MLVVLPSIDGDFIKLFILFEVAINESTDNFVHVWMFVSADLSEWEVMGNHLDNNRNNMNWRSVGDVEEVVLGDQWEQMVESGVVPSLQLFFDFCSGIRVVPNDRWPGFIKLTEVGITVILVSLGSFLQLGTNDKSAPFQSNLPWLNSPPTAISGP